MSAITPESTLVRRLVHGKISRALCLEAVDRIEAQERLLSDLEDMALEGGDVWTLERIAEVLGPLNTRIPR